MSFITFRRYYLDRMLEASPFYGRVLDVGGKKEKRRGDFNPPLHAVDSWEYLNIDAVTKPDYCCSAEKIPVPDEHFNIVLMAEVIEHLKYPRNVLRECCRILKKDGNLIATMPFLFPIHADPHDFQRWTDTKIKLVFESVGFSDIKVTPMGGTGSVIHDLLYVSFSKVRRCPLWLKTLKISKPLFLLMDRVLHKSQRFITTGYFVVAKK